MAKKYVRKLTKCNWCPDFIPKDVFVRYRCAWTDMVLEDNGGTGDIDIPEWCPLEDA